VSVYVPLYELFKSGIDEDDDVGFDRLATSTAIEAATTAAMAMAA